MIKRFLKKIIIKVLKRTINKLGYTFKRYNNPIIFDVGGNRGQSIEKYLKIFDNPIIHSFEPIKTEFDYMCGKFKDNKNIFLNNFALGDKTEKKEFHVTARTGNSSFNKINLNSDWLKVRAKRH